LGFSFTLGLQLSPLKHHRVVATSIKAHSSLVAERRGCPNNPGSHRCLLPPRERMAAGLRPSRTNAARPRSRGSPLHTHKCTRLLEPETKPREAHEPREPARALRHGPLRELEECAAPRLPLRGPCHRLPVCRRRWRGRKRGRRSVCGGARGVAEGAERAGPEDRDVHAGVLRGVHGRRRRQLRAHAHDRHAARPRQVQHAGERLWWLCSSSGWCVFLSDLDAVSIRIKCLGACFKSSLFFICEV
jgi:hypothetical protein